MSSSQEDGSPAATEAPSAPHPPCEDQPLATRIEALLIASERPLAEGRLGELLGLPGKGSAIEAAIAALNAHYDQTARSFRVHRLAGGWQLMTQPDFGPLLERLHEQRQESRLTQSALETLAIIAYRQPIMRAELEAIRGVACGEVLRGLLERRLIKIVGRAEQLGRPMLYGTTHQFLKTFGLAGLDDLPPVEGTAVPAERSRSEGAGEPPPDEAGQEPFAEAPSSAAEVPPAHQAPVEPETRSSGRPE